MAQVYNQNFDAFSDGSLIGQGGWTDASGGGSATVGSTYGYSGKGVGMFAIKGVDKQFGSNLSTSTQILRVYRAGTSGAFDIYFFQVGFGAYCLIEFGTGGSVLIYDNGAGGWQNTGLTYSGGTWYTVKAEFDNGNKRYRASLDNGATWSGYYNFPAAQTTFGQLRYNNGTGGSDTYIDDVYVDDQLGASYPSGGTTQTQTGVARITATSTQTQTGKARVTKSGVQTQQGKSRVAVISTQTQSGKAKILQNGTTLQNQLGKASIKGTTTQTQTGISRVSRTAVQTQAGISRITVTSPKTQAGVARVLLTSPKTILARASIIYTRQQSQAGRANLFGTSVRTQSGKASIIRTSRVMLHTTQVRGRFGVPTTVRNGYNTMNTLYLK